MVLYSNDYGGWIPRTDAHLVTLHAPYWMFQLGPYIEPRDDWEYASNINPVVGDSIIQNMAVFNCPEHPLSGEVPGTYISNQFNMNTAPVWVEDGPIRLTEIINPVEVIWVTEAADSWKHPPSGIGRGIYFREQHDAWHADHLPGAVQPAPDSLVRVTDDRHRGGSNVLLFDNSVKSIRKGTMTLPMFDNGRRGGPTTRQLTPR